MIQLRDVSKHYPPRQVALQHVDVRIKEGEFVFLAGASGAGKSTLLKLLYGATVATSGEVVVADYNLSKPSAEQVAALRKDMGIVFQDYKLLPRRSVVDNVAYTMEVRGVGAQQRRAVALHLLEQLGLKDRASDSPLTLSGGEQQRVAIARALIHKPRIILADEPTGNLDRDMTKIIFDLLLQASREGVTILVATHNLSIIEELNLRTIILDRGKVFGDFTTPKSFD